LTDESNHYYKIYMENYFKLYLNLSENDKWEIDFIACVEKLKISN
jgi:hypothetical protein